MRLDSEHALSPPSIEALRALIQNPPMEAVPSEAELIDFVLGTAEEGSRLEVVAALVRSSDLRRRLVQLGAQAASLRTTTAWQSADAVDSTLVRIAQKGLRTVLADEGVVDALDPMTSVPLRETLAAIGRNLRVLLAVPRYATARGMASGVTTALPPGVEAELFASVEDDGTLRAQAEFFTADASGIAGKELCLDLLDPAGGALLLARDRVRGMAATFEMKGFGAATGLEPGVVPAERFRLRLPGAPSEPAPPARLVAESPFGPVALELRRTPTLENGRITLELEIAPHDRRRLAELRFELSLTIGSVDLMLGGWPVSRWADGRAALSIAVAEFSSAKPLCGSLLRARFVQT